MLRWIETDTMICRRQLLLLSWKLWWEKCRNDKNLIAERNGKLIRAAIHFCFNSQIYVDCQKFMVCVGMNNASRWFINFTAWKRLQFLHFGIDDASLINSLKMRHEKLQFNFSTNNFYFILSFLCFSFHNIFIINIFFNKLLNLNFYLLLQ